MNEKEQKIYNSIMEQLNQLSFAEERNIIQALKKYDIEHQVLYDGMWMSKKSFNKLAKELNLSFDYVINNKRKKNLNG